MRHFKFRSIISLLAFTILSSCSNLNKGEIAKVNHSFSGCFGSETNKLTVYKESGSTFAKLEINGKVVRDIKLSTEQIETFNTFVDELSKLKEKEGCTTVEEYVVYTKSGTIRRTDGGCSWNGFSSLERGIFGSREK